MEKKKTIELSPEDKKEMENIKQNLRPTGEISEDRLLEPIISRGVITDYQNGIPIPFPEKREYLIK